MDGILLYWQHTWEYWNSHTLQILVGEKDSKFRKSYLTNSDKSCFGDREVSHRKMEGAVPPFVDRPVWDWDGEKPTQNDGMYRNYLGRRYRYTRSYYHSGVNYAQSVAFFMTGWADGSVITPDTPGGDGGGSTCPSVWTARIVKEGDRMVLQTSQFTGPDQKYRNVFDATDTTWYDVPEDVAWQQKGYSDDNGKTWTLDSAYFSKRSVSYEQFEPLPYYWIDHMKEIKPRVDPALVSEAIRNAITENTTLASNSYANLTEAIDMIRDFRNGKIIDLIEDTKEYYRLVKTTVGNISKKNLRTLAKASSKKIANGWLQYRYAYSTTKSDLEQYAKVVLGEKMGRLSSDRVIRGSCSDDDYEVRVKMRLHDNTKVNFDYVLIGLNQWGLMPSLYNLWDMIPYSFIADWFSNLGDYLGDIDESRLYQRYYEIDELLVSYKCVKTLKEPWGTTTYTWYDRQLLEEFPQWEIFVEDGTTAKTFCYRINDAVSLIVGTL